MLKKVAAALFFVSAVANSASFDCSKAVSKVEKLICSTPALSQADDALYVDYLQAKLITGNTDDFKALAKQNWKLREKNCDTEECLLNWYKRSTELYRQIAAKDNKGGVQSNTSSIAKKKLDDKESQQKSQNTLDDFFRDNPSLDGFYVKRAIKMQASGAAAMDSFTLTDSSKSKLKIAKEQMDSNGYEYAKLAVRQLKELCSMGMATMHSLKDADCATIISYVEK
ncbi:MULTISPECIES: lysozyme inhibitor LprI family protein [Xenorhabdus]|uniref:lysozyme inhibitor LprI family protein n=1 Tax=Xenorhabdus TaxID=626 RepID=UPI000AA9CD07|nr:MULTISPECIES: hypothetical protein [Xenorhabdus]